MKNICITDYLGPGSYLLYKHSQQLAIQIAEKGFKVYHCNDVPMLLEYVANHKINNLLINDEDDNLNNYIHLLEKISAQPVNNIIINTTISPNQHRLLLDYLQQARKYNYIKSNLFYKINSAYDPSCREVQTLTIALRYQEGEALPDESHEAEEQQIYKTVTDIASYVRQGDNVLILTPSLHEHYKYCIEQQTKSARVSSGSLENLQESLIERNYHFVIIDGYDSSQIKSIIGDINTTLLPAGRLVIKNPDDYLLDELASVDITPEIYFTLSNGMLSIHTYQGEKLSSPAQLCVLMKSPLATTDSPYEETIYGYSQPPLNLLAFARDYVNPWLIRGIVEFPFRNRSSWNLKKYSLAVLEQYDSFTPDYAAALSVLGYQILNGEQDTQHIVDKISMFCAGFSEINSPTAHQTRWFISLSTLLGLIHNKNNDKLLALVHFSHAANTSVDKFSPSIGTKILQSMYFKSIILLSLNKKTCSEITVDSAIKRGTSLLQQKPEELVGQFSQPFDFVMYIYHDIIDWMIKLINLKKAILSQRYNLIQTDNNNTWSALLHERMNAINNMSQMINERDIAIHKQTELIDERDLTILKQNQLIDERDVTILNQNQLISERDKTLSWQKETIDEMTASLEEKSELIDILKSKIVKHERVSAELKANAPQSDLLIDEKDKQLSLLRAELEEVKGTLQKIENTPIIGALMKKLNIK